MPLHYFRVNNGAYATSGEVFDLADDGAAWTETIRVCGDLVGGIARGLQQNAEWRMELLDDPHVPRFRIRLLAETLKPDAAASDVRKPADL